MTIQSERINSESLVISLSGRLDTATAPMLERKIKQWEDIHIDELVLDFADLTYISSMGLRVLLQAQKTMQAHGCKLLIKNMSESIREVFAMTGFINLMVQDEKFVVIRKDDAGEFTLSLIGQMDDDDVPMVSKGLVGIRKTNLGTTPAAVVLDMAKLVFASDSACQLLKKAITDTAWEQRRLTIRNASRDIRFAFENAGIGDLLEAG